MNETDRHRRILDFLKDRPFATVRELEEVVDASPATIRRDIGKLHDENRVRKVFGGIASTDGSNPELHSARPFLENQMLGVEAKRAIATEAEKLVQDGNSLIIHGGTTCYLFAQRLAHRNVRIYTNSMPLAATLGQQGSCHLTLAGGDLYREPGVLYSANGTPPEFYASKFFLGAQALGPSGVMESSPLIVREVEKLLVRADEVVILADSRKFGLRARYNILSLSRIGTLVTDDGISRDNQKMCEDAGIRVIIADVAHSGERS
jgi:DeoR family transcriptional regulator, ulaG and ulaABCDEF operon transcriptional repressor